MTYVSQGGWDGNLSERLFFGVTDKCVFLLFKQLRAGCITSRLLTGATDLSGSIFLFKVVRLREWSTRPSEINDRKTQTSISRERFETAVVVLDRTLG